MKYSKRSVFFRDYVSTHIRAMGALLLVAKVEQQDTSDQTLHRIYIVQSRPRSICPKEMLHGLIVHHVIGSWSISRRFHRGAEGVGVPNHQRFDR